jgi:hypothetical protein
VKFAKITALLSAGWTFLCAVLIVGLQVTLWLRNGIWETYSLSSVIKASENHQNIKYVTASSDKFETEGMADWVLEIPAMVPLLIALALLLTFYWRLRIIENRNSMN